MRLSSGETALTRSAEGRRNAENSNCKARERVGENLLTRSLEGTKKSEEKQLQSGGSFREDVLTRGRGGAEKRGEKQLQGKRTCRGESSDPEAQRHGGAQRKAKKSNSTAKDRLVRMS